MVEKVNSTINKYSMISAGDRVLMGLSGGADSVAMLLCLKELSERKDFTLLAAHYNHKLRGASSDSDEWFCSELCARLGIALYVGRASLKDSEHGMSEDEARELRYSFFEQTAAKHKINKVATAHNANDNAETVIFNLIRGTGLSGLCGIPPVRGNIIRPLIRVARNEILEYLEAYGQNYVIDKTNLENKYSRNKIRNLVMPILSEINPSLAETIARNSEYLECDYELIDTLAEECTSKAELSEKAARVSAQIMRNLPFSVCGRVLRKLYCTVTKTQGGALSGLHIESMIKAGKTANPSKRLKLPLGARFYATTQEWVIVKDEYIAKAYEKIILINGKSVRAGENPIAVSVTEEVYAGNFVDGEQKVYNLFEKIGIDSDKIKNTLYMRSRKAGDKIEFKGMDGSKSIKKLFNELKIPANLRDAVPVITDGDKVVAIAGYGRVSKYYCVDDNTFNIMYIQVVEDR